MTMNEASPQNEQNKFEVIIYEEEVQFKYTLPDEDEERFLEHELTIIWEDTIEKFIEEYGADKAYEIRTFRGQREKNIFIEQIEGRTDDLIEEVQEEIANKMKFGFEFSGQLHNDD
jgi:hypothetical protein